MDILVLTQILDDSNSQTLDGNNLFFSLTFGDGQGRFFSWTRVRFGLIIRRMIAMEKYQDVCFLYINYPRHSSGSVIFTYMYHRFKPIHVGKYTIHYIERLGLLTIFQGVTWKHPLELPPSEVFFLLVTGDLKHP